MKRIKKTSLTQKTKIAIVLSLFLALILTASILVSALTGKTETKPVITEPPEVIAGEGRQNGLPLAYPSINSKIDIKFINIKNPTGEYGFLVYTGDTYHTMYYVDSNGKQVVYYPEICQADPSFEYSSLFAIDSTDGYGQYTIVDYLCSSLQNPYFDVRIPIEKEPDKRAEQLKNFGFDSEKENEVFFSYVTELGETVEKTVKIGEKSVTGNGYYFIVYDNGTERPYIYSSLNNHYTYATSSMNEFVKPLLVSDGLDEDSGYGPYLTTGYYQWLNKFHDGSCECDKYECECRGKCEENCSCSDACKVTEVDDSSKVIVYADTITPIISENKDSDGIDSTGYRLIEVDLWAFKESLEKLKGTAGFIPSYESRNYERAIAALSGKSIGDYNGKEIVFTFVDPNKLIDFADKQSVKYEYKISEIKAALTDSGEISTKGTAVGEHNLVKVVYTAKIDGKDASAHPMCAVLDLSAAGIDSEVRQKIKEAAIGEPVDISFAVDYTSENALRKNSKYKITEIIDIFDAEGKEIKNVTDTSIVGYRYEVYVDGILSGEATYWLDLAAVTSGDDLKIKNALIGKKAGRISLEFDEYYAYYEHFLGFTTSSIQKIDSFVTRELVSAFKFQNSSQRDPYYGESLYENLMTDERKLYGLNASICEQVVKILGGLSNDNANATAAGLAGDEVVEIGLTPEVMKKYGLYAYTVYFELPRGIKAYEPDVGEEDSLYEKLDDYSFRSTLGFNLYISEIDLETDTRYIASDLYNVVTRVPADDFVFLKYDFETFWARRNILLVDIINMGKLGVEFNMKDLVGGYTFELTQPKNNSDSLGVHVTTHGECTPNKFTEFISNPKNADHLYQGGTSLKTFYLYESLADEETHEAALPDSLGASCFREMASLLYMITYTDILPEEVREEEPDSDDLVMKLTMELRDGAYNASPYTYVYNFYRIDDRRVRVSIHQESMSGQMMTSPVSDFYISTFAMKKIVNNFVNILNAEVLDIDVGYED